MLACRRALFESTWEQIIDGCKNYKAYCQASGREGSDFVQAPQRFIEDCSFLEEFTYQAAQSKEEMQRAEIRERDNQRMAKAVEAGNRLDPPIRPWPLESVAAFETRVRMQTINPSPRPRERKDGGGMDTVVGDRGAEVSNSARDVSAGIASLAARFRIAK